MALYLILSGILLLGGVNTFIVKKMELGIPKTVIHFAYFNLINALFACIYFLAASGFSPEINLPTFIFSLVFAVNVCISLVTGICILSYISISSSAIINTMGSIVFNSVAGILFFKERLSPQLIISAVLLMTAVFLSVKKGKKEEKKNSRRRIFMAVFLSALSIINSVCVNIVTKLYALNDKVCDSTSFFFYTNVILVAGAAIILIYGALRNHISLKNILVVLSPKQIGMTGLNTAASNIGSILSVMALAKMDISLYTVVVSSFAIIRSGFISMGFREKMGVKDWLAVLISIMAIIINFRTGVI